jgi:hypothetical protein
MKTQRTWTVVNMSTFNGAQGLWCRLPALRNSGLQTLTRGLREGLRSFPVLVVMGYLSRTTSNVALGTADLPHGIASPTYQSYLPIWYDESINGEL